MFWDKISGLYDLFENIYNKKVYQNTGKFVAREIGASDTVLECACGTGEISRYIAPICQKLVATDYSVGMLKQARKKLAKNSNVSIEQADIMQLKYSDEMFDCVVAGNVVHLLQEPKIAIEQLMRVCKPNGKIIIPTYINGSKGTNKFAVKFLEKLGARFKVQFDEQSYKKFFADMGFCDVKYFIVKGKMSCDIAVITK